MSLFEELKRRNVIRVGVAYLIASWLILQVSELVLEAIEAPAWVLKVFLLLLGLGLPIVLLFSWAYELTADGVRREEDVDRSSSITQNTGKKLNQITIAMIVVLVIAVLVDRSVTPEAANPVASSAETQGLVSDKSIAVLAFEDLSPAGDQEYFADGLSEELLNVLAQTPDLQVAGRTSSFAFKGQNRDLREIGEILNVAHILEGSVRKAGDRIRVTAQLINADTGFHLYSETYDRDLIDVFAVQDEISAAIAAALRTELIGTEAPEKAATSIEAYDLYLIARQKLYTRQLEEMEEASRLLDQAIAIDANYAPALAQKALALVLLSDDVGSYGTIPAVDAYPEARRLVDRAIEIDPVLAEAHAVSGLIMGVEQGKTNADQIATLEHALSLNPNLDNTRNWLSIAYGEASRNDEATELLEDVVKRDPLYGPAFNNLIQAYLSSRDFDLANALVGRVERIVGETDDVRQSWGMIALAQGEPAQAVRQLRKAYEFNPSNTINQLWYGAALNAVGDFETQAETGIPITISRALTDLGRYEEAEEVLDSVTIGGSGNDRNNQILRAKVDFFMASGKCEAAVDYVENRFTDIDTMLSRFERVDGSNSSYLGPLTYCYLQTGRDAEFQQLVGAMEEYVARHIAAEDKSSFALLSEINLAALSSTDEELLAKIQQWIDYNAVGVNLLDAPLFDRVRDNPKFQELDAIILRRANAERAKLGLAPYIKAIPSA